VLLRIEAAEYLRQYIIANKDISGLWTDLSPENDVPVKIALDPFQTTNNKNVPNVGIFLIPGFLEFDSEVVGGDRVKPATIAYVTMAVSHQLTFQVDQNESYDIAPQIEWTKLTNLKDNLDHLINKLPLSSGYQLVSLEPDRPDQFQFEGLWLIEVSILGLKAC